MLPYPINGAISMALGFFLIPVTVVDTEWIKDETTGVDVQQSGKPRSLQVAVEPGNSKNMEMIFGGSVEDGDIGIWSSEPLYMEETYETGVRKQQSFVDYEGHKYRVAKIGQWQPQTGLQVYLAKLHIKQEVV